MRAFTCAKTSADSYQQHGGRYSTWLEEKNEWSRTFTQGVGGGRRAKILRAGALMNVVDLWCIACDDVSQGSRRARPFSPAQGAVTGVEGKDSLSFDCP